MSQHRKLIEVSLPLEEINRESAREKSIRHGHPSTLHLWWARRPLAAARAVLFGQLVDDPSSHPDRFPTQEDQRRERERLHDLIRRLVQWENIGDEGLMREAHAEIVASAPDGTPPAILDPFAGGGTIPLEAQRLGLEAHASDLNPVAVLINKALIEIPPKFANRPPVFPGAAEEKLGDWPRSTGLAEDVRRYGEWMREQALAHIGHLYPKAALEDGTEATVIAWIWARTVTCPNPACGIAMPLVRSWWLGKKKGKEAYVVPEVVPDAATPNGRRVTFSIGHDPKEAPTKENDGTVGRHGAHCVACGSAVALKYIREQGRSQGLHARLMAVVAVGRRQRIYLAPSERQSAAANIPRPGDAPEGTLPANPRDFKTPNYGMTEWADLFTNRQLVALTTFSDLVVQARERVLTDAGATGLDRGDRLEAGGDGAAAYADAVATYLGVGLDRIADRHSSITTWDSSTSKEQVRGVFARQAVPMAWDFAESNIFSSTSGSILESFAIVARALSNLSSPKGGIVVQGDAASSTFSGKVVSTDPPYYDNIGYSDLSDFFYVWLRRSLREIHPDLLSTLLVPKAEELVANPYRHGGRVGASEFFEGGFERVFAQARESAREDYPITVYYAFKQSELDHEGIASTGWATLLEGMIRAGWAITATWPVRSELRNRMIASGTNALASSIVLVLRPRNVDADVTTRRGFIAALRAELPAELARMRETSIAPVDFDQATIGPGMAIFSRYGEVVEANGDRMAVRTALALINQTLDEVLAEQDGELDADTRFCLTWYERHGWNRHEYGDAEGLARRFNVSVDGIARGGVISAREGWVILTRPGDMSSQWDPRTDDRISHWEVVLQLARVLENEGADAAARLLASVRTRHEIDLDVAKQLALRLYRLAQQKDPQDAGLFNALGTEWVALSDAAAKPSGASQSEFDLESL